MKNYRKEQGGERMIPILLLELVTGCLCVMPRQDPNIDIFADMADDYSTSGEQYEFRGQTVRLFSTNIMKEHVKQKIHSTELVHSIEYEYIYLCWITGWGNQS
jgi:hypothetical protein